MEKVKTGTTRTVWGIVLTVLTGLYLLRGIVLALGALSGGPEAGATLLGFALALLLFAGALRLLISGLNQRKLYLNRAASTPDQV